MKQTKQRLLLTGASGFIGGNLAAFLAPLFQVFRTHHNSPLPDNLESPAIRLDLTLDGEIERLITDIKPHVVVNAAALTSSNYCARNPEHAREVNVKTSDTFARLTETQGVRLIHLSTDLVFGGHRSFYREADPPDPICTYGLTKYESEIAVRNTHPRAAIIRTALVYGWSRNSARCFTEILIEKLRKGETVQLFTDEFRTPVYIRDLCSIILQMINCTSLSGTYNVAGVDRLSRYEFGLRLSRIFDFRKKLLKPTRVEDFEFIDGRPKDCSLDNTLIRNMLNYRFSSLDDTFLDMKKQDNPEK